MAICYVPSTTNKASDIKLKDTNDNYTSNDVEGALVEVNEQINDIAKDISGLATKKYVDDKFKGISIFPLDMQTVFNSEDNGGLSDENNQLIVDWFNEIINDEQIYTCLYAGSIVDILGRGSAEIEMSKVVFDGVGLTAYTIIINKSAEDKITITLNTKEFSLTPKLE